ncbi:MAG: hypothetical protein QW733_05690 [Desulfurococcaceae archaeon]
MAYTWEPRWEVLEVNYEGIRFKTCRDKTTGLIACPICIHAASKCLGERPPSSYEYENTFFYSVEDLIEHLKGYHIHGLKKKIMKLLSKETEGEE